LPESTRGRKRSGKSFGYVTRVTFDVLIVLGCRVSTGPLAHAALRRVERAALAYHEHGAELVIASGGKTWQGVMEAEAFARHLARRGLPEACLLLERESMTTRGNARGTARLLLGRVVGHIGLVTCDWHMPRALRLFERVGLRATPLPAPTPPGPLHVALTRRARERASALFDYLPAPRWFRA
jgi:uncharacterized SAM-binding protein YcdF (DUF218 family)